MLDAIKKLIIKKNLNRIHFGDFRRLSPVSKKFGYDRGSQSIARYYIDNFIEKNSKDIQGRVLEIGDAQYTKKWGKNRVTKSDILNFTPDNPDATIIADLTTANNIESNTFDCIILTQTLQCIYDHKSALFHVHRILKPGGVVLATLSGISQISRYDMDRWGEYWRFTSLSAKHLFTEFFQEDQVTIEVYGNVLAAISLLEGLASSELEKEELDFRDQDYEIVIAVRAMKPL
jgi:hypothetical protein